MWRNAQRGAVGYAACFLVRKLGCVGHALSTVALYCLVAALAVYWYGLFLGMDGLPFFIVYVHLAFAWWHWVGLCLTATSCISCCVQWVLQLMHLLACVALIWGACPAGHHCPSLGEAQSVEVNLWSGHKREHPRYLWTSTNSPNG